MATFRWSKTKLSRKLWVNIFGLPKIDKIMGKRLWKKRWPVKKQSEFWIQLREKQLTRYMYWLSEKQLKKYYDKAVRSKNVTSDELIRQMETRVDNVVYRAWFASSRPQARQLVAHWHLELNWRKITIPSIQMKAWDKISIKAKSKKTPLFDELDPIAKFIKWIKPDIKKQEIVIEGTPDTDEMEKSIKTHLIIEWYSRR